MLNIFIFLTSFLFSLSFAWSLPFILFRIFKYQLYHIKNKEKVLLLSSKIKDSSITKDNQKPSGFFISYFYIGIFVEKENSSQIYLLTSTKQYEELVKKDKDDKEEKKEVINLYERTGNFCWLEYINRNFNVEKYSSRDHQVPIINTIIDLYNNKKMCTAFIYGLPGSGKSMIGILLAKALKGSLVRTFNPSEPGDSIISLYNEVSPGENNPLIIVFDEVDIMIDKIHNNKIITHATIPIQIQDKTSWNRFFDDIDLGLYPNTIFILTSNISIDDIGIKYDNSYLRDGRIDTSLEL
jgi:hypothetical protein